MITPPRQPPRFLPTLTEVVTPSELALKSQGQTDTERITQKVLSQFDLLIEAKLRQGLEDQLRAIVLDLQDGLISDLKTQLHPVVKKLVIDAVAESRELNKFNS